MKMLSICLMGLYFLLPGLVNAGSLDSPAAPTHPASAMYSLEDLYNRLNTGAPGVKRSGAFTEPSAGPTTGTGRTIGEVMGTAPRADNVNGAVPGEVVSGKTYWGLRSDGTWGLQTGTLPAQVLSPESTAVGAGIYTATTLDAVDPDLASGNIRSGAGIFGVSGDANVVNTASGDAVAAELVSGKKAWVDGSEVTGSMANNGAVNITPGTASQAIAAGYHSGTGIVAGDPDLTASNIRCGATIFGVGGSMLPACVAKTGQIYCYKIISGGVPNVPCAGTGQDGDHQKGCLPAVPPSGGPSFGGYRRTSLGCTAGFVDNGNGTVTDNLTGLIWLKNANCFGKRDWDGALAVSNALTSGACGLTDGSVAGNWRLPNLNEMRSLFDPGRPQPYLPAGHPFTSVQWDTYWTSTTAHWYRRSSMTVSLKSGGWSGNVDKPAPLYVWPVRGGQ